MSRSSSTNTTIYSNSQGVPYGENINIAAIILFPLITLILGSSGGILTAKQIPKWYASLKRPSFIPPNWVFGPAWTILYLMIGFSAYFVFQVNNEFSSEHTAAWVFFFIQFILNLLWTPIFFYFHKLLLAAIEIVLLDIAVLVTIILFHDIAPIAGYFLIPYMCWISFATYMSWGFWYYNKERNFEEEEAKKNEGVN